MTILPPDTPGRGRFSADPAAYRLHYVFVEESLVAKAQAVERCSYLGFYLLFLVGFCVYFLYDIDVSGCSQLRARLLDTLTQTPYSPLKSVSYFADVSDAQEYSVYVVNVVAPLVADVFYPTGSSIILGAMRLRTQRSDSSVPHGCGDTRRDLMNLYHTIESANSASSVVGDTAVDGTLFTHERSWRYYSCHSLSGSHWLRFCGYLQSYHCGGFLFDVPMWLNRTTGDTARIGGINQPRSWDWKQKNYIDNGDEIDAVTGTTRFDDSFSHCVASSRVSGCASGTAPSLGTAEQAFPFANGTLPYERVSLQVVQESYLKPILWGKSVPFLDDDATRIAVTELLFYSPPLQRFAAVKLVGEVSMGGSWKTSGLFASARVWTRDDVWKTVYDAVIMGFGLVWICFFVRDVRRSVVERMKRQCFAYYTDRYDLSSCRVASASWLATVVSLIEFFSQSWNLMTLVILCLLMATGGLRVSAVLHSIWNVPTLDIMIRRASYPMEVEYLLMVDGLQLYLNATVTILLFYRALYYVSLESRAALLMRVLSHAQSALVGGVLTVLLISTVFAMSLSVLYGNSVWAFRNVGASVNTLLCVLARQQSMSALTSGSVDSLVLAFVLFAFVFLCGLFLINLSVAIVANAFAEVRKAQPVSCTGACQTRWVLQRAWRCAPHPREWLLLLLRWCTGRGDAALLRHAARCLRAYRAARFPLLDHIVDELGQLISEAEFTEAMSLQLDFLLFQDGVTVHGNSHLTPKGSSSHVAPASTGELFTAASSLSEKERKELKEAWRERWRFYSPTDLWRDIVQDWLASTTSDASQTYKEEHTWLRSGVQAAVGDRLALLRAFPLRLAVLERKLESLESHVLEKRTPEAASLSL